MATVKGRTSSKSNAPAPKAPSKSINYNFNAQKESASQYNSRIASERGDSASQLKSMQRTTGKTFSDRGLDANKVNTAGVITPASLQNTPTLKVPPPIMPTGTPDIAALNSALGNPLTGTTPTTEGGFTLDPITQNSIANQEKNFLSMYKARQENAAPDIIGIQQKLDRQTGIDRLKGQEAEFTGQIDSIVKNSQAQSLALEGQGRGQTTQFLGGEQARIQREAAVAALPVQAQLAAVQGKIQVANDYINKWGTLLVQDATNRYNQKNALIDATFSFANSIEQQKLTSLQTQAKAKKDADIALANAKTKAMAQALSQPGGSAVMAAIQAATDENGVVAALGQFNGDILGQQLQREQIASAQRANRPQAPGPVKRDTQVVDGKLIDMQTGQVISDFAGGVGNADEVQKGLDQVNFLRGTITEASGLVGATGPNAITRGLGNLFVGNTKVKQLQNKIDTLKTNLLTLNSDPNLKKFFGPQMTEKDTELLMSAGSTLDAYSNSVAGNEQELARYDTLLKKIQTSFTTAQAQPVQFGIVTAPDGMEIEIIPAP